LPNHGLLYIVGTSKNIGVNHQALLMKKTIQIRKTK